MEEHCTKLANDVFSGQNVVGKLDKETKYTCKFFSENRCPRITVAIRAKELQRQKKWMKGMIVAVLESFM